MKKRLRRSTYQPSLSNDNANMIVMAELLMSSLVVDVADAMELYVEEGVEDTSVTA